MVYWASMGRVYLHSRSGAYIKMIAKISSQFSDSNYRQIRFFQQNQLCSLYLRFGTKNLKGRKKLAESATVKK